jgi:hypothetical protein
MTPDHRKCTHRLITFPHGGRAGRVLLIFGEARGRPERSRLTVLERTRSVRAAPSARAIAQRSRTRGANA